MYDRELTEELLLTWIATHKNTEKAFLLLKWRLFLKKKSAILSLVGVFLGLMAVGFIKIFYRELSFEKILLMVVVFGLIAMISLMNISFTWDDFKQKKLTKQDLEFFMKFMNSHSIKLFNALWRGQSNELPRTKIVVFEDLFEPYKKIQDKFLEDEKKKKEIEAKKKDMTVSDILEIGQKMLAKNEKNENFFAKKEKKKLL